MEPFRQAHDTARIEDTALFVRLCAFYEAQNPENDGQRAAVRRTYAQFHYLILLAQRGRDLRAVLHRNTAVRRNRDLRAAGLAPVLDPAQLRALAGDLGLTSRRELMNLVVGVNGSKVRSDKTAWAQWGDVVELAETR